MKVRDLTELAARNLREAVLRNSLTTLGISVGVASLVALLSLGVGLQQLVNRSVARAGLFDAVSVRPRQNVPFGQPGGGGGRRAMRDASDIQPPRALDDSARKEIAALPNVLEVNPEVRFTAEARREPNSQLVLVAGMAPSSQSSGTLDGMTGTFFSGTDAEEAGSRSGKRFRHPPSKPPPTRLIRPSARMKRPWDFRLSRARGNSASSA